MLGGPPAAAAAALRPLELGREGPRGAARRGRTPPNAAVVAVAVALTVCGVCAAALPPPTRRSLVPIGPDIIHEMNRWVGVLFAVSGVCIGLMVCCLGIRVIKLCAFLLGFGLGAMCGGIAAWRITLDDKATLIACFSTGAAVGLVSLCLMKFGRYVGALAVGFLPVFLFIETGGTKVCVCVCVCACVGVCVRSCVCVRVRVCVCLSV